MKKFLVVLFTLVLMIPVTLLADEKVKVYVFEAGGCPYCEAQIEYLEGLEGYNKTFEIIKKELYVDHVEWKHGKDYDIGKKVAETFKEMGFDEASYEGTPFVVISDLYAAASYDTGLEKIINQAYEEGDKDAVSCIANASDSGTSCVRKRETTKPVEEESKAGLVLTVLALVVFVGVIVYVLTNKNNRSAKEKYDEEEDFEEKVFNKELDGLDTPKYGKTPKKKGYKFAGWEPEVSNKVKGNATYRAKWQEDKNNNGVADEDEYRTVTYTDSEKVVKKPNKKVNNTNKKRTTSSKKRVTKK